MKKTSYFTGAVVLLLALTYYFEFYRVTKEEHQKEESSKIIPFPADQIHQITVENQTGKALLKRDADGWRLEEPVKDWADNTFAEEFVEGLATEKTFEVAAEGDSIQWPLFGLDKNTAKISFANQQGTSVTITVSDKKNFEGNSFLRRDQENKVLIASAQWPVRAQRRTIDFRDKRLFRGKIGGVDEISIKSSVDEFKLLHKDGNWIAEKDPGLNIDQNRVREILTSLNETRASDYLDAIPGNASFKARIALKLGDKIWAAELRQSPDKTLFAHTTGPEFNLKMSPGQSDKLFEMTLASLQNRKEPFDFKNLAVQKIELQTPLKKTILIKDINDWKVEGNPKAVADNEAVKNFISKLANSAVGEYLLPKEKSAFQNPGDRVILKDEKQQTLIELTWGPTVKRKIPTGEKTLVLVRSSLYKEPFGVDNSVIESWGLPNLFPKEIK